MATVVYQRYGDGRVMVLAGQGLWQWAFLPDELSRYDMVYNTFWSQMVRWLISGSDFLPGQEFSLKTDRPSYVPGDKVNLLIYAKRAIPSGREIALEVFDAKGARIPITPGKSDAFGAALVGIYTPKEVGDYTAVLRTGPDEADRLEAPFIVAPGQEEDLVTAADPQLMQQISAISGGRALRIEDLPSLPDELREAERRTLLREEKTSLWDRPWVFLVLCGLLGTEWALRRRAGLC